MPLEKAKCENCGAVLEVDSSAKLAICQYCNTPYIVREAINHYQTHIGSLHVNNLTIQGELSTQGRLDAAEAYMQLKNFKKAQDYFKKVCDLCPQDYRGWWGQVRAITEEFSKWIVNIKSLEKISNLYKYSITFASEQEKRTITEQFQSYYSPLVSYNNRRRAEIPQEISRLEHYRTQSIQYLHFLEQIRYPQYDFPPVLFSLSVVALLFSLFMCIATSNYLLIWMIICIAMVLSLYAIVVIRPIKNSSSRKKEATRQHALSVTRQQINDRNREINALEKELHHLSN